MSEERRHPVFVYGTLLRGLSNHGWLAGGAFVSVAEVAGFALYDLGEYPAVVPGAADARVVGELWHVDDEGLARLDVLEDAPTLYRRERVDVRGAPAWIYILNALPADAVRIPGGDYDAWLRSSQPVSGEKTSPGA